MASVATVANVLRVARMVKVAKVGRVAKVARVARFTIVARVAPKPSYKPGFLDSFVDNSSQPHLQYSNLTNAYRVLQPYSISTLLSV